MTAISDLRDAGVSIWLDDLSRTDILSGRLAELIAERGVTGITTNPTIFATAVEKDPAAYTAQLDGLRRAGSDPRDAALEIVTADVRAACDILLPVHERSGGADGFVSIEVTPEAAHDTAATLAEVRKLRALVDRPNLFVKIPSTDAGVRALEDATAEGASINMTLLFGLDRYRQVREAYRTGLARAVEAGIDPRGIRSVASFFVSRVDVAVDRRLDPIGGPAAAGLRGLAAVANARLAYAAYEEALVLPGWQALAARGAHPQRPLWASTGVKDPAMRDTRYIEDLVAPEVVDTVPSATLEALHDHGRIRPDTIRGSYAESRATLDELARVGVPLDEVTAELERAGIGAFGESWGRLLAAVQG
ncbi:transaldolase [Leifsonia sp. Leaf336]|uniref:transaldolase n=1 Tax=Leifsonia sp. Leaf336 TaxID=1736341 RepID=UPI0006F7BBDA|nr:transaldolase [Leifsonia sp. Leaf336]KQR54242.1 transaldolase [Leifsonia sp. Leaf336]